MTAPDAASPSRAARPDPPQERRVLVLLVVLGLLSLSLAVFWPVAGYDFVNLDDGAYVLDNLRVRGGLTPGGILWAFRTTSVFNWHPLTWLSLMADVEFFGVHPGRMHLVNTLLHSLNGALLFLVLRGLTGAFWRSALGAALFLVHPLHVESVAWISERKDVLSTAFWLLTLWAYGRYATRPNASRFVWVLVFFALGLMSKAMVVTLPLVLLLLDFWPLCRLDLGATACPPGQPPKTTPQDWRRLLVEKAPLVVLALAAGAVTYHAQQASGAVGSSSAYPLFFRLANALRSYGWYLLKTGWPTGLAAFYPHPGAAVEWVGTTASVVTVAVVTVIAWKIRRFQPYLLTGWLWYLGTLVPVLGLVQVGMQARADRYTYIPLVGIFVIAAWGLADLAARARQHWRWVAALAAAWVLALGVAAHHQVRFWENSFTLARRNLEVAPGNWMAYDDLGIYFQRHGRPQDAEEAFRSALAVSPDNPQVLYNLGLTLELNGRWDEALELYGRCLALTPDDVEALSAKGLLLTRIGSYGEGLPLLEQALRLQPGSEVFRVNLAWALATAGERGRPEALLREALGINPDYADAHLYLGRLLAEAGRRKEAAEEFRQVLRVEPERHDAREELESLSRGFRER
jgi:tetratricopeptide (TPR) repeat protein